MAAQLTGSTQKDVVLLIYFYGLSSAAGSNFAVELTMGPEEHCELKYV